jgi:xanthine dehydrogenase accessory factor
MLDELRDDGMTITDEMLAKVFGPTGLEIGAETAEEIALSIIAEIKAVLTSKPGGMLRYKEDVIHSREETRITEKRLH